LEADSRLPFEVICERRLKKMLG